MIPTMTIAPESIIQSSRFHGSDVSCGVSTIGFVVVFVSDQLFCGSDFVTEMRTDAFFCDPGREMRNMPGFSPTNSYVFEILDSVFPFIATISILLD